MPPSTPPMRRNRTMLLLIVAVFFGSLLFAGVLRFSGWRPAGMKNHGELLQPPRDLRAVVPHLADGSAYAWQPQRRLWRMVVAPPAGCVQACIALARKLDTVRRVSGQESDRLQILWIGTPPPGMPTVAALQVLRPDPALLAGLPRRQGDAGDAQPGVPVYVIDPNGFVILRYAPGFEAAGLRADLSKLLKLM